MAFSIRSLSFGLNRRPIRRTPLRNTFRPNVLRLEDRVTPDGSADIFAKLNEGLAAWERVAGVVAEEGLKSEVPFVRDSLAKVLKADAELRKFAQATIADVQALPAAVRDWFVRTGWTVNRLELTPDATGRLLEVSRRINVPFSALSLAAGGDTGFAYFDNRARGDLTGRLVGAVPPAGLDVTVGVDVRDGQLAFYIGEGSGLAFKNMTAAGQAAGELGIGRLTVHVRGGVELKADAALRLRDPDLNPDGRVRIADFDRPLIEVVRGDVTGSVKFKDVKLTAKLERVSDLKFGGNFAARFANGEVEPGATEDLGRPDMETAKKGVVRAFLNNLSQGNLLGSIGKYLNKKLPVINKSLNDLGALDKALGWLTDLIKVPDADLLGSRLAATLTRLGITLHTDAETIDGLIRGEEVDLVTFARDGGDEVSRELFRRNLGEFGYPPLLSASLTATAGVAYGWSWNVRAGISTGGLWFGEGSGVDAWFRPWAQLEGSGKVLGLKLGKVTGRAEFNVTAFAHLADPSPGDQRVYLTEIIGQRGNLARKIVDSFDAGVQGKFRLSGKAEVKIGPIRKEKSFAKDYTLFNYVRSARFGAVAGGEQPQIPVSFENGILTIHGTDLDDRVKLTGGTAAVTLETRWTDEAGQAHAVERTFEGVREVRFFGNYGNDVLEVAWDFTPRIVADGGDGDDTLQGGAGDDSLSAGPAGDDSDLLVGRGGNDDLTGNGGGDTLHGGDGSDVLHAPAGDNTYDGGAGDDLIRDGAGHSEFIGGDGNDTVEAGAGDHVANLGHGDDQYTGGSGIDEVHGGEGNDHITLRDGPAPGPDAAADALTNVGYGGEGNDTILGGAGGDLISGDEGADSLAGGGADDTILGGDGNDRIEGGDGADFGSGGAGADVLLGGEGDDALLGGDGTDRLEGERGDDGLDGGSGANHINGGPGADTLSTSPTEFGGGSDFLIGGPDKDVLEVNGTGGADDIRVRQLTPRSYVFAFQFEGSPVAIEQRVNIPLDVEVLQVDGGAGDDRIAAAAGTTKNLSIDGNEGDDTLIGGRGRDSLRGGDGNDMLNGGAGSDDARGGDGDDVVDGGADPDNLLGDAGNDTVRGGGGGHDILNGGDGNDVVAVGPGEYGSIASGDAGDDTLIGGNGVDVLFGGSGADLLLGGAQLDVLFGGAGDDRLAGETGRDFVFGDGGNDLLRAHIDTAWRLEAGLPATVVERTTPWTAQYQEFLNRETEVFARVTALELKEQAEGLTDEEREERQRLSDELAILNLAENDINPHQRVQVDLVLGGDGDDTLRGSPYPDLLAGEGGDDTFVHAAGQPADVDTVQGGGGLDTFVIPGTPNADDIRVEYTSTDEFPDRVDVRVNGSATRVDLPGIDAAGVDAGAGADTVTMTGMGQQALLRVWVDLGGGNDTYDGSTFEASATVLGGAGDDTLDGGLSDDSLDGGDGDDSIMGGQGYDSLAGGDGTDNLDGGTGNDSLTGGDGDDVLSGQDGEDVLYGGTGHDHMDGGAGGDLLEGDDGYDTQVGGAGNDAIRGGASEDLQFGGEGDDEMNGGTGNDTLHGGPGADVLNGGDQHDFLDGEAGNNTLYGGSGTDDLVSSPGNTVHGEGEFDRLLFTVPSPSDVVVYRDGILVNGAIHVATGIETYEISGSWVRVWRGAGAGPYAGGYGLTSAPITVNGNGVPVPVHREAVQFSITAHMQLYGDSRYHWNSGSAGTVAGMSGSGLRLEGFSINPDHHIPALSMRYMANLAGSGDTGWVTEALFVGTRGLSRPMYGFAIELTGAEAAHYTVQYRAKRVGLGWSDWANNGQFVGAKWERPFRSSFPSWQWVEAMEVRIVPR